jgi:hypothetical protein
MAAVAVSVGAVPVAPELSVYWKSVEQLALPVVPLTQAARMSARVSMVAAGRRIPKKALVIGRPVATLTRLAELRPALVRPVRARAVPELETWVASVAKPAKA